MYARNQNNDGPAFAKMLENCANFDKDVRHTGALDLCNEICKSLSNFFVDRGIRNCEH